MGRPRNAFERVGMAGKLILKKQFQELKLTEGGDMKQFLLQFEKILRQLRAVKVKMQEEDVVCTSQIVRSAYYCPGDDSASTVDIGVR